MPISSAEVDALVLQYLKERGCLQSADAFKREAGIEEDNTYDNGVLVLLLSKSLASTKNNNDEVVTLDVAVARMDKERDQFNLTTLAGDGNEGKAQTK